MQQRKFSELLNKIKQSNLPVDYGVITRAFDVADEAHAGQLRKDKSPFVTHPIAAAEIIAQMGLDTDSIAAGLLHDCIEDTHLTYRDIKVKFGSSIADLVDGVTKLGRITYSSKEEEQMEDLRKMFMAMAKDIRVILIKLADRLHNMRTLSYMSDQKRRDKALETMEVYAPIAHRLGMQRIKWELEDLSLETLDPVGYKEITDGLLEKSAELEDFLSQIKARIHERMREKNVSGQIDGRVKHIYSIYRKMYSQNKTLDEIYDICAVRVIVNTLADCYSVLGIVHDLYKPIHERFKDYISTPKPNLYKSVHTTVVGREGMPFEVQIRTYEMHQMAEYGVAAHWKYKQNIEKSDSEETYAWIRQLLETQQDSDAEDFIKRIKIDLFADEVFVFTPKGDVKNFPAGATPVDFGYAIHSEVGNRMTGAKINGRIVPLDYQLQNGEIIEVMTSKEARGPSRDWLKIAQTGEARNKIRQWFKKERREENVSQGREELERELRVHLLYNSFEDKEIQANVLRKLSFKNVDELYAGIGYGGVTVTRVLNRVRDEVIRLRKQREREEIKLQKPTRNKKNDSGVIVEDLGNCMIKFARCCTPVPGDEIVGFVTKGYGVSVHRADCVNAVSRRINELESGRWVRVYWEEDVKLNYSTGMQISAKERVELLADVATVLSQLKIKVLELTARNLSDGYVVIFAIIEVTSLLQLNEIIHKLRRVPSVLDIVRAMN